MCVPGEGARERLHYNEVVDDVSAKVSRRPLLSFCVTLISTHEKMTRFGSRFLEKGRRSGSCFDVHSSMVVHYCIRERAQVTSGRSGAKTRG